MQYPTALLLAITALTSLTSAAPQQDTDDRVENCGEAYVACVNAAGAVIATCATQRATCLGYSAVSLSPSLSSALTSAPTDLPDTCSDLNDACRAVPGANMATCSAQYAACLGYNPYATGPVTGTPTALTPSPAPTFPGSRCGEDDVDDTCTCEEIDEACRQVPGANLSLCTAQLAACLGLGTSTSSASVVVVSPSATVSVNGSEVVTPTRSTVSSPTATPTGPVPTGAGNNGTLEFTGGAASGVVRSAPLALVAVGLFALL